MVTLHDAPTRDAIKRRIAELAPSTPRRWGKMTVGQMLWHVSCSLENALGRYPVNDVRLPIPHAVIKFLILRSPMRHRNAPTAAEYRPSVDKDFENERVRLLRLIDEFTARPFDGRWPRNAFMGQLTGEEWSRLQARHLDHHLTQFGV